MPNVDVEQTEQALNTVTKTISAFTWVQVVTLVAIIVGCLVVKKIVLSLADKGFERFKLDKTLHTFSHSALNILLWFVIILIVAEHIGFPVSSLLAVLGVIGLALSLAIQGTLSNLAGGIMLLTAKPFGAGDYVEAGGVSGTVRDIGLVYTRVLTVDNRLIFIPNSEISGSKILNYTHEEKRRVDLVVSASYDAPVEQVEEVLLNILRAHPKTFATPEPFARVSKYGSSAIDYTMRVWCATGDYWDVYFDLMSQVKKAFDAHGIEMTYDHLNVHLKEKT